MKRVVLIGANGQLGGDLQEALRASGHAVIGLTHADIEVTDVDGVRAALARHRPEVVINTAAYHKVDEVEQHPERAFLVNAIAPWRVALACREEDAAVMFISSDYVFGGDSTRRHPYTEADTPAPLNVYGASKLAGECLVRAANPKHYVVRTCGLYGRRGASGKGGNFVETMLRLAGEGKPIKVVNDQRLTPTHTVDVARALTALIETGRHGLYHVTSEGDCTWYEFAAEIFQLSRLDPNLSPTTSAEFKTVAARPSYSVLSKAALASVGLPPLRHWQDALSDYLRSRKAGRPR
jgi:dTDP-4-dehydrorhamnose reductase